MVKEIDPEKIDKFLQHPSGKNQLLISYFNGFYHVSFIINTKNRPSRVFKTFEGYSKVNLNSAIEEGFKMWDDFINLNTRIEEEPF